ncbi:pyridoxal phosphate homeostasis protein-like [Vitis riparia]|uniref:pyridoxal phosphate homeostasis protein-like n=1 Tax=Vitis riparia TaxID=96939 RepID=UPI00155AAE1F|nr:pyridoxal phosphate homeostasis protein-like [Vitis riparia]
MAAPTVIFRVRQIAERSGRRSDQVRIMAVSKPKPVSHIRQVHNVGHRCFGESYIQEMNERAPQLPKDLEWYFMEHLRSNQMKQPLATVLNLAMVEGVNNEKKELEGSGSKRSSEAETLAVGGIETFLFERSPASSKPCGGAIPLCMLEEFSIPPELVDRRAPAVAASGAGAGATSCDDAGATPDDSSFIEGCETRIPKITTKAQY